jgi:hypothetical protein
MVTMAAGTRKGSRPRPNAGSPSSHLSARAMSPAGEAGVVS